MICTFVLTLYKNSNKSYKKNLTLHKSFTAFCKNMLSEMFFKRNSFIKKSVEQSKIKNVKNVIIKKWATKVFHLPQGIKNIHQSSSIYHIDTGRKVFYSCCFWRFVSCLDLDRLKNLKCTLVCRSLLLLLYRREGQIIIVYVK